MTLNINLCKVDYKSGIIYFWYNDMIEESISNVLFVKFL